ncbi:TonB-dependent receptor [Sphingomonas lacunae]|uniref:TonB-dependent receptor n=1 Tax=Sphingomonas lacunae TaxID=2698828 RepID=A0A6M4B0Q2_9SPHN|nr:TonB-dependent receptor [Sphingomonas lacunae]QJQ32921.1 TonB-dependent receptor [Sphingomonas lacunae]
MKSHVSLAAPRPFAAASLTAVALALAAPALAQQAAVPDEASPADSSHPIDLIDWQDSCPAQPCLPSILTVWGERSDLADAPAAVSVITRADLDRTQALTVADALTRIPGVTATSNGQLGSFTGLRIRGADATQTLVIIDGVRVGDPSSPGGGFDFGNLTSAGITRVEILNGSNSLAWGSDAIGGVVLVETLGRASDALTASAEGGSHGLARIGLGGGLRQGRLHVGGHAGYLRTDGISAASSGREADGFRQFSANGRASLDLDAVELSAAFVHASGRLALDGYAPPAYAFGDTAEYQETQENYASVQVRHYGAFGGQIAFDHGLSASLADINRDSFDPAAGTAPGFAARGRTDRIGWTGTLSRSDQWRLIAGVEHERSRMATASAFGGDRQSSAISAGWVQLRLQPTDGLDLGGGVRRSDHRDFGGATVFAANASWRPGAGDWKLRASFAEGYKAPTLFQLSPDPAAYGNPSLRPERSRSYDAGVDYALSGNRYVLSFTLFRRDSDDLIDFVGCSGTGQPAICATGTRPFGTYANIARARAEGVELGATVRASEPMTIALGYAHVATRDRTLGRFTSGNRLARRPANSGTLSLDYAPPGADGVADWSLGADLRWVGASFDDAGNSIRLPAYALAGVRGAVRFGAHVELYGRIDNLFDARYENVFGYGTYGRTFAIGVRWRG